MSRRNHKLESDIRSSVEAAMTSTAKATGDVFIPPPYLAKLLFKQGVIVTRTYINRRYAEAGIIFSASLGLWVKE